MIVRYPEDAVFITFESLRLHGKHNPVLVVPCPSAAALRVLKQAVVSLRIEQPGPGKAGALELVIHVGRDHKTVLVLYCCQQIGIDRFWRIDIAVEIDMPGPPGPAGLGVREGPEAAGIHIRDAEAFDLH